MPKGTIKKLTPDRGFGFIAPEGGGEGVFFHRSAVADEIAFDSLREGQAVTFDIEQSDRGPRAKNVRMEQ